MARLATLLWPAIVIPSNLPSKLLIFFYDSCDFYLIVRIGTLLQFRMKHVPEVPEVLPKPSASIVDSHNDAGNLAGVREVGGFHFLELHITTLWGASGVVVKVQGPSPHP